MRKKKLKNLIPVLIIIAESVMLGLFQMILAGTIWGYAIVPMQFCLLWALVMIVKKPKKSKHRKPCAVKPQMMIVCKGKGWGQNVK